MMYRVIGPPAEQNSLDNLLWRVKRQLHKWFW
jgi:hypothetical protein